MFHIGIRDNVARVNTTWATLRPLYRAPRAWWRFW